MEQFFCVRIFVPVPCHSPAKGGLDHAANDPEVHPKTLPPVGFFGQGQGKRRSLRCHKSRPAVRQENRQRRGKLLDLRSHGESMAPAAQDHSRHSVPNPEGPTDTRSHFGCSRVQRHGVFRRPSGQESIGSHTVSY